jgi:hypothetical protein
MFLDKYWQFALCGWNSGMSVKSVMAELGHTRALANKTGYGMPGRNLTNWPAKSNTDSKYDPAFDKDRTTSNSMLSGIEYPDGRLLFKDYKTDKRKVYTGYLALEMMDGNKPPALKPGRKQPERIEDVRPEDYLHHPKNPWDWHLFFALNIINFQAELIPFAGGALYPWYFDGKVPVCFMPHVSRMPEVKYPTELLEKLPLGTSRVKPYT